MTLTLSHVVGCFRPMEYPPEAISPSHEAEVKQRKGVNMNTQSAAAVPKISMRCVSARHVSHYLQGDSPRCCSVGDSGKGQM